MGLGSTRSQTGRDARSWPVLLLLLVVVLVPTVGVLWFMTQAMRNERLAVRQKLSEVYEAQLLQLQESLQSHWQERTAALAIPASETPGSHHFAERVRGGLADGLVILDTDGAAVYPAPVSFRSVEPESPSRAWSRAQRLERQGRYVEAAEEYGEIARESVSASAASRNLAARALQARARCLVRAGETPGAIEVLTAELQREEYRGAADSQGRLVAPSARLRAVQLLREAGDPTYREVAASLVERLRDYGEPTLPATQRRFLLNQLTRQEALDASALATFDTLAAEELTARYLESEPPAPSSASLQPTGLPGIWHLEVDGETGGGSVGGGSVVALYEQQRLIEELTLRLEKESLQAGVRVTLWVPGEESDEPFLVSIPAGGFLQDWLLVLHPDDKSLFATAASQQITAYRLTGLLLVVTILLLTLLAARMVDRQLRLTRLKNDLLSTVSHELKTPLASMRLLVETLLDDGGRDPQRDREYLQLIGQENLRLSRLVENFLTFSRMEQKRQSFEKRPVRAEELVEAAVAAVGERFRGPGCRFTVQTESSLAGLYADADALVTVLLNLLDNAYKYSGGEKEISLRVYNANGSVCFEVRDNGVGLSRRAASKIFDRFYQVDQSLSSTSGCGLGLSIVRHIVDAHGGSIDVDSQPGKGSAFTVRLPASSEPDQSREEAA